MAIIGGIVFAQAAGPQVPAPYPRARMLERPGTDGRVVRMMPAKAESVEWETVEWVLPWAAAVGAQGRYDLLRSGFDRRYRPGDGVCGGIGGEGDQGGVACGGGAAGELCGACPVDVVSAGVRNKEILTG